MASHQLLIDITDLAAYLSESSVVARRGDHPPAPILGSQMASEVARLVDLWDFGLFVYEVSTRLIRSSTESYLHCFKVMREDSTNHVSSVVQGVVYGSAHLCESPSRRKHSILCEICLRCWNVAKTPTLHMADITGLLKSSSCSLSRLAERPMPVPAQPS